MTAGTENLVGSFDCGDLDISAYLNEEAAYDREAVTYLLVEVDSEGKDLRVIGYLSLSCSAIIKVLNGTDAKGNDYTKLVPAALIDHFAILDDYHGLLYREGESETFSERVFLNFINDIIEILHTQIGAQYIVLYATDRAYNFYHKCGFLPFDEDMGSANDPFVDLCIPMYMMID